jgi:hypothetical protein
MNDMKNSFTAPQIEFLTSAIFDALSTHFGYSLSDKKREKVMALALDAERGNYDALLQRARRMHGQNDVSTSPAPNGQVQTGLIQSLTQQLTLCEADAEPLRVSIHHLRITDWHYLTLSKMLSVNLNPTSDGIFAKLVGAERIATLLSRLDPVGNITLLRLIQVAVTEYKTVAIHFVDQAAEDLDTPLPDFSEPLVNDNCLANIRCPYCGEQGSFSIETSGIIPDSRSEDEPDGDYATFFATWEDDGSTETEGDTEFPDGAGCVCRSCGFEHPIDAFRESSEVSWNTQE